MLIPLCFDNDTCSMFEPLPPPPNHAEIIHMIVCGYEQRADYKRYNLVGSGPDSVLETFGAIYRGN